MLVDLDVGAASEDFVWYADSLIAVHLSTMSRESHRMPSQRRCKLR
jgi:hypothetical protein